MDYLIHFFNFMVVECSVGYYYKEMFHFMIKGLMEKGKEVPVKDSVFSNLLEVRVQKEIINTRAPAP